jgi:NADH:ubiquinone oxidoreductase subunit F (NADH-binding)
VGEKLTMANADRKEEDATTRQRMVIDQKTFALVAGAIFAVVALLHLVRIALGWPVVIGSWTVPIWVSWIGLVAAGGLGYVGLRLATQR